VSSRLGPEIPFSNPKAQPTAVRKSDCMCNSVNPLSVKVLRLPFLHWSRKNLHGTNGNAKLARKSEMPKE